MFLIIVLVYQTQFLIIVLVYQTQKSDMIYDSDTNTSTLFIERKKLFNTIMTRQNYL